MNLDEPVVSKRSKPKRFCVEICDDDGLVWKRIPVTTTDHQIDRKARELVEGERALATARGYHKLNYTIM